MFIKKQSSSWTGWFKNSVMFLCLLAFFIMPIANILSVNPALAADPGIFERLKPEEKYKFFQYATAMSYCFSGKSHGPDGGIGLGFKVHRNPSKELKDNIIFNDKKWDNLVDPVRMAGRLSIASFFVNTAEMNQYSTVYVFTGTMTGEPIKGYDKGSVRCTSQEFQQAAFEQFKISPNELLCQMGYRKDGHKNATNEECVAGNSWFTQEALPGGDGRANFINALSALTGYPTDLENNDPYIKYRKYQDWIAGCVNGGQVSKPSNETWTIPTVSGDGKVVDTYQIKGSLNYMWDSTSKGYAGKQKFLCTDIISQLKTAANEYAKSLKDAATKNACSTFTGKELEACKAGIEHKGDSTYCEKKYTNAEEVSACKQGQSAEIETPSEGDGGEEEGKNSCGVDGIGWLVCPLMSFAGSLGDASYSAISYFLSIDKGIFKDQENGGLEQAWKFFRDIANAVFAVIFLWVIFSQISNVGVSNYGIKKILPRLIIGALLVNLSFYLCQLAVDLSNILGFSLKGVLEGAASKVGTQSAEVGAFNTLIVDGLALVGIGLFIFLAVSIPTIMALLLALLVVLVILIVRQAAVILLIAISPLAFAAWLLPNTENLFKKWVSMLRGLLIVFPVISLLYGAGKLAGAVLAAVGTDDPNNPKETMQVAALAASILPLGATPFVLQSSLNSLGNIGAKIGKMSANAHGRFAGNVKGTAKRRVDNSVIGDTKRKYLDFVDRKRASMRTGKIATWRDNSPLGKFMGWDKGGARARATVAKAFESDVENASTMLQGMTSKDIADIANGTKAASKAMRAAAIDHTMANGGFEERMEVLSSLKGVDASIKQRAIKASFAKGDNNIIGNKFGDAILKDEINNMEDLSNMAVNNAESGSLQAEHLVQNGAATGWLSKAIANSKNEKASAAFKKAGEVAVSNPNTAKNINQTISDALSAHGVGVENTPQNTSSSNSQQNSQGSSSQQSSQNNQQNNSSSGEKIIIATSQEDIRKALEDSRRRGN